jgi:hypothetical protein
VPYSSGRIAAVAIVLVSNILRVTENEVVVSSESAIDPSSNQLGLWSGWEVWANTSSSRLSVIRIQVEIWMGNQNRYSVVK